MRHELIHIIIIWMLAAASCGSNEPGRPESDTPPAASAASIYFATSGPVSISATTSAGEFGVIVARTGSLSEALPFSVEQAGGDAGVKAETDAGLRFAPGLEQTLVKVRYDIAALTPGRSASITLGLCGAPVAEGRPGQLEITVSMPAGEPAAVAAAYVHDCKAYAVTVTLENIGDASARLAIRGDGLERDIGLSFAPGGAATDCRSAEGIAALLARSETHVAAGAAGAAATGEDVIVEPLADAAQRFRQNGVYTDYIYNVEDAVDDGGSRLFLALAYSDGGTNVRACIDRLELGCGRWKHIATGTYVDGWLLPAVTLYAQRFEPTEWPWPADVLEDSENHGIYRLVNLYHSPKCPLRQCNGAAADAVLTIDARKPDAVVISPQAAPFYNGDLWPGGITFADGIGSMGDKAQPAQISTLVTDGQGRRIITIPCSAVGTVGTAPAPLEGNGASTLIF